jgi:putative thiamine transport system ATP-binding protein
MTGSVASAGGLRLEHVSVRLGARELLALDAVVPPGAVLTVMGPSGAGKSTLLALIAGFLAPPFQASGRVVLDGRDLGPLRPEARRVGLLFQDALLYPHLSVGGNLLFGLTPEVRGRAARRANAEAALTEVGLAGCFERDPATLSGGEQARVALARTLLARPHALLLDEPFSRLDADRRAAIRDLVFRLVAARAIPAVLVTHDRADAAAAGGPVVEIGGESAAGAGGP